MFVRRALFAESLRQAGGLLGPSIDFSEHRPDRAQSIEEKVTPQGLRNL